MSHKHLESKHCQMRKIHQRTRKDNNNYDIVSKFQPNANSIKTINAV